VDKLPSRAPAFFNVTPKLRR